MTRHRQSGRLTRHPHSPLNLYQAICEAASTGLIGRQDLARELGISLATVDRRTRDGSLPNIRVGRRVHYELSAVMDALRSATGGKPQ